MRAGIVFLHSPRSGHIGRRGFDQEGRADLARRRPHHHAEILAIRLLAFLALGLVWAAPLHAARQVPPRPPAVRCGPPRRQSPPAGLDEAKPPLLQPREAWTAGSVKAGGTDVDYCAVAGTLLVHPKDWDDAAPQGDVSGKADSETGRRNPTAVTSMFYVAYLKRGVEPAARPVTFLFNGGPGSATLWLHMGAFGPKRIAIPDTLHAPAAPYRLVSNDRSLLDASDLVFIDAPGTGFSRIAGDEKEKSFYGVDEDARAFAAFITSFLSKYHRWNSPKYLFGESYGTTRAAVLADLPAIDPGVDFNGVIMLSQVLANNFWPDRPEVSPGNDLPYQLALPTYAATAWYHRQPAGQRPPDVPLALLTEVERFAIGDYAAALAAGAALDPARREAIVAKLSGYIGLSEDYPRRADLRVGVDQFRQELLRDRGLAVGDTDTRYLAPTLDRMSRRAGYDPTDAAITSAYISSFNDYARRVLNHGEGMTYRPSVDDIGEKWNFRHVPPGASDADVPSTQAVNTMPDLAHAMKYNPLLKVQVNAGYFDLITPYFQGRYEMWHLPVPAELRGNVEYHCYQSGHMVYPRQDALVRLHDNVAGFIDRTSNLQPPAGRQRPESSGCPPIR